jgi:hypothetical protein
MDGTAVEWHGWTAWNEIGKPLPAMIARIRDWLDKGYQVKIFTSRLPLDQSPMAEEVCKTTGERYTRQDMIKVIADYFEPLVGQRLEAINIKHYKMYEYWDDIAVQMVVNTGQSLAEVHAAELTALRGAP